MGNLQISTFKQWQFSLFERPCLPHFASIHSVESGHCLTKVGFYVNLLITKQVKDGFGDEHLLQSFSGVTLNFWVI